jgi:hypothetical protein
MYVLVDFRENWLEFPTVQRSYGSIVEPVNFKREFEDCYTFATGNLDAGDLVTES